MGTDGVQRLCEAFLLSLPPPPAPSAELSSRVDPNLSRGMELRADESPSQGPGSFQKEGNEVMWTQPNSKEETIIFFSYYLNL